jgi:hypothetical protein
MFAPFYSGGGFDALCLHVSLDTPLGLLDRAAGVKQKRRRRLRREMTTKVYRSGNRRVSRKSCEIEAAHAYAKKEFSEWFVSHDRRDCIIKTRAVLVS